MNKNTFYNSILPNGGQLEPILPVGFFFIGSIQPKTPGSDYIESKTTSGGKYFSLSMYKNTLPLIQFSACNANPATGDLNFSGNAKTISREDCLYT
jgi:hypothetical protein